MSELRAHRSQEGERLAPFSRLTVRECEVLQDLIEGKNAERIANDSFVSVATVRSHIKSLLAKLGVNSQLAAVAAAQRAGLDLAPHPPRHPQLTSRPAAAPTSSRPHSRILRMPRAAPSPMLVPDRTGTSPERRRSARRMADVVHAWWIRLRPTARSGTSAGRPRRVGDDRGAVLSAVVLVATFGTSFAGDDGLT